MPTNSDHCKAATPLNPANLPQRAGSTPRDTSKGVSMFDKFRLVASLNRDARLSNAALRVAIELVFTMNTKTGECYPRQSTLMAKTRLGATAIKDSVKALREAGWLVVERPDRASSNRYTFTLDQVEGLLNGESDAAQDQDNSPKDLSGKLTVTGGPDRVLDGGGAVVQSGSDSRPGGHRKGRTAAPAAIGRAAQESLNLKNLTGRKIPSASNESEGREDPEQVKAVGTVEPSALDRLWQEGKPTLARLCGMSQAKVAPIIGRLLRSKCGGNAAKLLHAIETTDRNKPSGDPLAYLTKCLDDEAADPRAVRYGNAALTC